MTKSKRSSLLSVIGNPEAPKDPVDCEFRDPIEMCMHEDLEEDALCQRQACPYPYMRDENANWKDTGEPIKPDKTRAL